MKKFSKKFKVGTKVLLEGHDEFLRVTNINTNRILIQVEGMSGSYQLAHVVKFSNKL